MPRHAKSEDAARNGFAPANLAPVAAAARPGLALEPRQGRDGNDGFGSHKGRWPGLGAGGPPGSRS